MSDLEKLVQAFGSRLYIKSKVVADKEAGGEDATEQELGTVFRPVPAETRKAFKKIMKAHLDKNLCQCQLGHSVTYTYTIGKVVGSRLMHPNTMAISVNPNMCDIFSELPELQEGEEYAFPASAFASVKVIDFDGDKIVTKIEKCPHWICQSMAAM